MPVQSRRDGTGPCSHKQRRLSVRHERAGRFHRRSISSKDFHRMRSSRRGVAPTRMLPEVVAGNDARNAVIPSALRYQRGI